MSIVETVTTKLEKLPPEKQQQVLEYVESLEQVSSEQATKEPPQQPLRGLWKDSPPITEEDIAEARREMWGNVPREDI